MDVPWEKNEDFIELYNNLFQSSVLREIFTFSFRFPFFRISGNFGYSKLKEWIKITNIDFIVATYELFLFLEKFELAEAESEKFKNLIDETDNGALAHKLIQIVNLIIDGFKKKKKYSQNMYEIAQKINFPKYIIDLRHSATHGKTPDNISLLFGLIDSLKYLKNAFWDKQYKIYLDEINLKSLLLEYIKSWTGEKTSDILINTEEYVKLELLSIRCIMKEMIDKSIEYDKINIKPLINYILSVCKNNKKEVLSEFIHQGVTRLVNLNSSKETLNTLNSLIDSILIFLSAETYDFFSLDIIVLIKNFYFFVLYYRKDLKAFTTTVSLLYIKAITYDTDKVIDLHFNSEEDNIFINDFKLKSNQ